jgi:hypothetical protein
MSRHLGSAQAWRSAALIGIAWLATGCVLTEDQRIDQELAQGRFEVHADALTAPLKTPATFAYAPGSTVHLADNRFDSFEIEGLLRSALARRLGDLGLTAASGAAPDYLVGYLVTANEGAMVAEAMSTIGMPAPRTGEDRELPVGTLVLAISAPRANRLIWKGSIVGAIDPESDPQRRQERADLAVAALLRLLADPADA